MDLTELYNIVGILRVFVGVLVIIFLLTLKSEKNTSNRLFALFLALIIVDFNGLWLSNFYKNNYPDLNFFRNTLSFLQVPVFYLYVISICYSNFRLRRDHLVHIIPLLIVNIVFLPNYYLVNLKMKAEFFDSILQRPEIVFSYIFIHILVTVYIIALFVVLNRFRKIYLQNYANADSLTYKWLFSLTCLVACIYIVALIKNTFKFTDFELSFYWMKIILGVIMLLMISWYLLMALKYPELFRGIDSRLRLVNEIMSGDKIIPAKEEDQNVNRLNAYMASEEPFLDASLTIKNLAIEMNLSIKELSVLINQRIGQHFFDYINGFRIQKATEILADPSKNELTVLEILYEVGFNSKSSFNTAFKKHTGTTPTAYRKRVLKQIT